MKIRTIKINNITVAHKIGNEINFNPPYSLLDETALFIKDLIKTLKAKELTDPIKPDRVVYILKDGTILKFTTMEYIAYRYLIDYIIKDKIKYDYHKYLLTEEIKERKIKNSTNLIDFATSLISH